MAKQPIIRKLHPHSKVKNMSYLRSLGLAFVLVLPLLSMAQNVKIIKGRITDKSSGETLPFATVNLKGTSIGTISNASGEFVFKCPNRGTLLVSFIGYESFEVPLSEIGENLDVRLEPTFFELNELVVRPLSAEQYILRVIRKFGENYATEAFETRAYYREKFIENDRPIQYSEGFFKTYYPDFRQDSSQHQLLLYRQTEDLQEIAFMASKREKKEMKARMKAEKNGEEYDDETDQNIIKVAFGGPEDVISEDPVIAPEDFLDSTMLKKFRYEYGENSSYQGRKLLSINFETKGKVDHTKVQGVILIDEASDAIVSVEFSGRFIIPMWARPLLFTFGLAIKEPKFAKKVRYQEIEGKWYPQSMLMNADLGIKKRYMFRSNDNSDFYLEQVFNVQGIDVEKPTVVVEENLFDVSEGMEEQIVPEAGLDWEKVNVLQVERDFVGTN